MDQLLPLLTNLATGAVGGNVAGAALKDKSLGFTGNTVAGLVGGLLAQYLGDAQLAGVVTNLGMQGLAGDVTLSGVGGAVVMAAVTYAKPYLAPYLTKAAVGTTQN